MNAIRMDISGVVQEVLEREKREHLKSTARHHGSCVAGAHTGNRIIRVAYDPPVNGANALGSYRFGFGLDTYQLLRSVREEEAQAYLEEVITNEVLRVIGEVLGDHGALEVLYDLPDEIMSQRRVLRILWHAASLLARGVAYGADALDGELAKAQAALGCTEEEVRQVEDDVYWLYSYAEEREANAKGR